MSSVDFSEIANAPCVQGEWILPDTLPLYFGGELSGVQVAWRIEGAPNAPFVLVLGGISAGRHVIGSDDGNAAQGWWKEVMGPGRALDTRKFRVLGIDFLGGSGLTTGPKVGEAFPSISAYDQLLIIKRLMTHLQIHRLHAVVGASYGGMVALALGEREPQLAERLVVVSAAHRTHPMATAWRCVQRAMVRQAIRKGEGGEGLRLARALAMATYRSHVEFAQRFSGEPERTADGFVFPVEKYLFSRGDAYKSSYIPESFVCLSESIDLHRVNPALITVPTTLIAVREDQLVPLSDMRELHAQLAGPTQWFELSSLYGHDAFLKEVAVLHDVFAAVL
jgi:homoserine O-acetyltransferase/O-succinyltransferase